MGGFVYNSGTPVTVLHVRLQIECESTTIQPNKWQHGSVGMYVRAMAL